MRIYNKYELITMVLQSLGAPMDDPWLREAFAKMSDESLATHSQFFKVFSKGHFIIVSAID